MHHWAVMTTRKSKGDNTTMTIFSRNTLLLCSAILVTGIVSANKSETINTTTANNHATHNISYTAHGKTDRRTARLFRQLLQNNPNMQIHAEVIQKPAYQNRRPVEVSVNYTIRGKTSMRTVRRMIELFKNSKEVQVSATAKLRARRPAQQNRYVSQPRYQNYYIPAYQPFYYNGYPPTFVQGNTIWYPVPLGVQPVSENKVQNTPQAQQLLVAGQ